MSLVLNANVLILLNNQHILPQKQTNLLLNDNIFNCSHDVIDFQILEISIRYDESPQVRHQE